MKRAISLDDLHINQTKRRKDANTQKNESCNDDVSSVTPQNQQKDQKIDSGFVQDDNSNEKVEKLKKEATNKKLVQKKLNFEKVNVIERNVTNNNDNSLVCQEDVDELSDKIKITPINTLKVTDTQWTIRARCVYKSNIRNFTYKKSTDSGQMFNVDFVDESGQIRATGFKNAIEKLYKSIVQNKIYEISNGTLKKLELKSKNVENQIEINLENRNILIKEYNGKYSSKMPYLKYNFVKINCLNETLIGSLIDIVGIVKLVEKSNKFNSAKNKKLIIFDESLSSVNVTLWGDWVFIYLILFRFIQHFTIIIY